MIIFNNNLRMILIIIFIFFVNILEILHADETLPNLSVQSKSKPKSIYLFADALYWYTSETVDWAFTLTQNQNSVKTAYKTFSFDWAPGFRIGFGYNMKHDYWDTRVSYTRFRSKATDSTSGSVTSAFLATRLSLLEPFSTGKATLNLHYNMLDWGLGRSCLVCKSLLLRPAIGFRGGWITQNIQSTWTIDDLFGLHIATENIKQKFYGGGTTGGLTIKWCFRNVQKHSFGLIGQFESDYLWGHWSIQDKFTDDLFFTEIQVETLERNFGSLVLRSFIGFEGGCTFDCERSYFGVKAGYQIEDWFNQFQIFSDASGSQNNNLILQGFNFCLFFTF